MAVISCYLEGAREFSADEEHRSHTENYVIKTDVDYHSPAQVFKMAHRVGPHQLPAKYDPHPHDAPARCISVSVSQDASAPKVFRATAIFDTKVKEPEKEKRPDNPLLRATKYKLELMQYDRFVDKDIKGKPIQNTLGKPFDPPLTIDDSRQVLVGVRNMSSLGQIVALQQMYKDAVNLNTFYGAKPRQAKVVSITAGDAQVENDVEFYEVAIRVAFKEAGESWQPSLLNQGMSRLTRGNRRNTETCKLPNGELITSPIRLAKNGLSVDDSFEEPYFIPFKIYPERDFRGLGI